MAEENKHMDDAFKRMSEEFEVSYNPSFWDEAKAKLDDANLDDAFRAAANNAVAIPDFSQTEGIDDMFMDSAFVDASANQTADYNASFFEDFMKKEGDLLMDDAFNEAAAATVVDYLPEYWSDADVALQDEGLHYEYDSAYWQEAKKLLDKSDRKIFFTRWSAVAAILLLLSFGGQFTTTPLSEVNAMHASNKVDSPQKLGQITLESKDMVNLGDLNANDMANQLNNSTLSNEDYAHQTVIDNSTVVDVSATGAVEGSVNPSEVNFALGIENRAEDLSKNESQNTTIHAVPGAKTQILQLGYARPIPEIELVPKKPMWRHSVSAFARSGIGNKWGDFSYMPTMRNGAGIEYTVSHSKVLPDVDFGGNLMVYHVRQNALGTVQRQTVSDAYGTHKYWRQWQLKDMVFTNLNLTVGVRIAPYHKLSFGAGVEYLTAVKSNMSYVNEPTGKINTINNNWGVRDGLNNWDMKLGVGYEYEISNRFTLQANTSIGVFDKTVNSIMLNKLADRDISLMMGVKYNLFTVKK
ncbi:hypothetical protein K6119_08535 [Paracrocinitomix mangrovi]|uniref:hypothetical protein n=1 Tax=Paracrocinitomix mangrovi TaxID=2862509 RepID=UPI001ED9F84F|nr:hypothetical protein [Paracrocinitomix mangrovi]UKN03559.1 hypothetical protein K6119_08535 [Paracrocinitomix mangrovi]